MGNLLGLLTPSEHTVTIEKALGKEAKKSFLPMQPGDVEATYADIAALKRDVGFELKTPLDYLRFLGHRLRANRYDVLLPTHEQAYLLARVRDRLHKYVGLALPPRASTRQTRS